MKLTQQFPILSRSPFQAFTLIALFIYLGVPAQASTIECSVAPDSIQHDRYGGNVPHEVRIVHEQGKSPTLTTRGNIDLNGTAKLDPTTGQYLYRFKPLINFRSGVYWMGVACGEFSPVYEGNCYDKRIESSLVFDPGKPENNAITVVVSRRTHPKVLGLSLARLKSWKPLYSETVKLHGCRVSN